MKSRLILRILTNTPVALLLLAGLAGCGPQEQYSDVEYYQRAEEAYFNGDLNGSIIELKNALQQNPDSMSARWLLGRAYTDLGDGASAEKELRRASSLGMPADQILQYLGLALLQQRQFQRLLDEIRPSDLMLAETVAEIDALRGWAYLGLKHPSEAEASFAAALERNSKQLNALLGQVAIAQERGNLDQAGQYLDRAVAGWPDNIRVIMTQGALAFDRGELEASVEHFRRAQEIQPEAIETQLGLARSLIAQQKYQEAISQLEKVLEVVPRHADAHYLLALAAFQQKDYVLARDHAGQVLDALPTPHGHSLFIAGASHYALKEYEQAHVLLVKLQSLVPASRQVSRLLAATQLALGQNEEAARTLLTNADMADEGGSPDDAKLLAQMGAQLIQGGQLGAGKDLLQRAVNEAPDAIDISEQLLLALAKLEQGERQEGLEDLQRLAEGESQEVVAKVMLVLEQIRAQELDQALESSLRLEEQFSQQPVGYLLVGMIHSLSGRFTQAREAFGQALERDPGNPDAIFNLAILDQREGHVQEARQRLEQALESHPDNLRMQRQLVSLIEQSEGPRAALERLQLLVNANPQQLSLKVMLAGRYLGQRQPAQALAVVEGALQEHPDRYDLLEIQGLAQQALGQLTAAEATFGRLVSARSDSPRAYYRLGVLYKQMGRWQDVESAMGRVLLLDSEQHLARLERAMALLNQGELLAADADLKLLASNSPDDPRLAELQGKLALAQDRPREAVAFYRKAFANRENNLLNIQLSEALRRTGQEQEAEDTLLNWLERHPDDGLTRLALGDHFNQQQRWALAEVQYRSALERFPDLPTLLNNLAWVQFQQGKLEEARTHAERALELAPQDADIQDTLAILLLEEGQLQQAEELLRQAGELNPNQPMHRLHLAQVLARQGDEAQARLILADIKDRHPNFAASDPSFQDLLQQLEP